MRSLLIFTFCVRSVHHLIRSRGIATFLVECLLFGDGHVFVPCLLEERDYVDEWVKWVGWRRG